jgi:hypothetical protein
MPRGASLEPVYRSHPDVAVACGGERLSNAVHLRAVGGDHEDAGLSDWARSRHPGKTEVPAGPRRRRQGGRYAGWGHARVRTAGGLRGPATLRTGRDGRIGMTENRPGATP